MIGFIKNLFAPVEQSEKLLNLMGQGRADPKVTYSGVCQYKASLPYSEQELGAIKAGIIPESGLFKFKYENDQLVAAERHKVTASSIRVFADGGYVSGEPTGRKFDADKPRFSLLPLPAIHETIKVLELGARKYAENNWQQVDNHRDRYYNAVQRHLLAWYEGERNDPETGLNHLAHASCNVLFLLWFDLRGDDANKTRKSL